MGCLRCLAFGMFGGLNIKDLFDAEISKSSQELVPKVLNNGDNIMIGRVDWSDHA